MVGSNSVQDLFLKTVRSLQLLLPKISRVDFFIVAESLRYPGQTKLITHANT
jgi:hypothetical protein